MVGKYSKYIHVYALSESIVITELNPQVFAEGADYKGTPVNVLAPGEAFG